MSNTVTITRKEETNTEITFPVPSFYREHRMSYVAVIDENTVVDFTHTDTYLSLSTGTPDTILKYKTNLNPIDADTFYKAYNKCIQAITQRVAATA